jgi:hypothetical protein
MEIAWVSPDKEPWLSELPNLDTGGLSLSGFPVSAFMTHLRKKNLYFRWLGEFCFALFRPS